MPGSARYALNWLSVLLLVYLLLVAVGLIGSGLESAMGEQTAELFTHATNPFLGLIVGIFATALVQSSSTVTSIIVGLVAGGLPVTIAVPMVMGTNVGTTITNTLVSLGHVTEQDEFRRAFAAATVHDFFNLLSIVIFLPLELLFHPLENMATVLGHFLLTEGSYAQSSFNFVSSTTDPAIDLLRRGAAPLPEPYDGVVLIPFGIALIFAAITLISRRLKRIMEGRAQTILDNSIGRGPLTGIAAGTVITVLVQSSSTTTSLVVPLAATGAFTLAQVYPFTLGANIGTCITALLAATAVSGARALPALEIAMVHLLYNVSGVAVIYSIPWLSRLPMLGAEWLSTFASEHKALGFTYVITAFFIIPGALLAATALW